MAQAYALISETTRYTVERLHVLTAMVLVAKESTVGIESTIQYLVM